MSTVNEERDVALAAERLTRELGEHVSEYQVIEAVSSDPTASKTLSNQLRVMSIIRIFELASTLSIEVQSNLDQMRPSDMVKMYTSLMSTLTTLTQPDARITFDFESEAAAAADEFGMSKDAVMTELKQIMAGGTKR